MCIRDRGTSAWYAPGAAGAFVVESIIHNQGKMVPCSFYLEGEYGESDICCGVPVILGKNGIEKIVELPLNELLTTFGTTVLNTSSQNGK